MLQEKVTEASLDELLAVRDGYIHKIPWNQDEKAKAGELDDLHKMVENILVQRIKEVDFEDLLIMK